MLRELFQLLCAMNWPAWEVKVIIDSCRDGHELFRIAEQTVEKKRDIVW